MHDFPRSDSTLFRDEVILRTSHPVRVMSVDTSQAEPMPSFPPAPGPQDVPPLFGELTWAACDVVGPSLMYGAFGNVFYLKNVASGKLFAVLDRDPHLYLLNYDLFEMYRLQMSGIKLGSVEETRSRPTLSSIRFPPG